ncbi:phage tail tape measure protein [Comamonas sp. GB3 AK4-5]|uniref:phage tail tape measure protein n=1 Tax=Comamonas sp. GB3 AK4-5 TaxID=3231487 RepID=UPI00351E0A61
MADIDRRKVQIEVEVNATGALQGFEEVAKAGRNMASEVAQSTRRAAEGVQPLGLAAESASRDMSRAEQSMLASIQRATTALQSGAKAGADFYNALVKKGGLDQDRLKPYIEQLREIEALQGRLKGSSGSGVKPMQEVAGAKNEPAVGDVPGQFKAGQFKDLVSSLQEGQRPMKAMLEHGDLLKNMFTNTGASARALGARILGLANPYALAAGAAAELASAYNQGSQEADAYAKALIMSGNAAGVTVGQLATMAQAIDGKGFTQGEAAAALAQLAGTGHVAAESIQKVAEVALNLEREAGVPIAQTVSDFAELGKSPVEASLRLTETHRYLTAEVYEQIKALQDQGRESEAAKLAQETYADVMMGRSDQLKDRLGLLESAWRGVGDFAKKAWDAMLGIGRGKSVEEQLEKQQQTVENLRQVHEGYVERFGAGRNNSGAKLAAAEATLFELQGQANDASAKAMGEAAAQQREGARLRWKSNGERYLDKSARLKTALTKARSEGKDAGASEEEIAGRLAAIRAEHAGAGKNAGAAARRQGSSAIQSSNRAEVALLDQQQRKRDLERQAGLVSEQDYYAQKRTFILEVNKAEEDGLRQQISNLESRTRSGKASREEQNQLAEARTKLNTKELESQNKLTVLDQEASAAAKRKNDELQSLTVTHERYLEQLDKQAGRQVETAWMGDKQKARLQGQWAIEDRYLAEQNKLQDQRAGLSEEQRQPIDLQLQQLQRKKARELQLYQQTYEQMELMQSKWSLGAARALENYVDQAANVAGQTEALFSQAFRGMEDALVSFAMTGKADFKSLADSIITEMIRIQIRAGMARMLGGESGSGGLFGSLFSGGMSLFGGGAGASSGAISPMAGGGSYSLSSGASGLGLKLNALGGVYDSPSLNLYSNQVHDSPKLFAFAQGMGVFGEAGPEAIMPLKRGPDGNLGIRALGAASGGSTTVVNVHTPPGAQVEQRSSRDLNGREVVDVFIRQAVSEVAGQLASDSGQIGQAMRARKNMGV